MIENKQQQPILIGSFSGVLNKGVHSPLRKLAFPEMQDQPIANSADLLRGRRKSKRVRLKLKRRRQMLGEIIPVMPARVQVKLMRTAARSQQLVKLRVALVEAK